MNNNILLLKLLTDRVIAQTEELVAYNEAMVAAKTEYEKLKIEDWHKKYEIENKHWRKPIPPRAPISSTLKLIRRVSLEIDRDLKCQI